MHEASVTWRYGSYLLVCVSMKDVLQMYIHTLHLCVVVTSGGYLLLHDVLNTLFSALFNISQSRIGLQA